MDLVLVYAHQETYVYFPAKSESFKNCEIYVKVILSFSVLFVFPQ